MRGEITKTRRLKQRARKKRRHRKLKATSENDKSEVL